MEGACGWKCFQKRSNMTLQQFVCWKGGCFVRELISSYYTVFNASMIQNDCLLEKYWLKMAHQFYRILLVRLSSLKLDVVNISYKILQLLGRHWADVAKPSSCGGILWHGSWQRRSRGACEKIPQNSKIKRKEGSPQSATINPINNTTQPF